MLHLDEATHVQIEIPDDVWAELNDEKFMHRQHYSRATYALGCHGPLCKLAEAHRGRRRNEKAAEQAGRDYEPNEASRKVTRDEELAPIISWHLNKRGAA